MTPSGSAGYGVHMRSAFLCGLCFVGSVATAAELTDVASSFDDDNPFDLRLRVGYAHEWKSASIKREIELSGQDEIVNYKDLLYARSRDLLGMRLELGLFQDLMLYGELPLVLRDSRDYKFDQSLGKGCVYPGQGTTANCVNGSNSSTLADGIVPQAGYDATLSTPTTPIGFPPASDLVFRGVARGGSGLDALDTINLGLAWAPLSQKRDDTKPTWIINFEGQISVGNIMKFDRAMPDANHGVSEGLHRLFFRTMVSHRFRFFEPYLGFWYMLPVARDDGLFIDYGQTQKFKGPQQAGGTVFGFEAIPYDRKDGKFKIALDLRGRIEAKFDGRGYSEAWEFLASSPALACDPKWNPACDSTKISNPYQGKPYTGLTRIENYATLGAEAALVLQLSKYARLNLSLQYTHDQGHRISSDDVGQAYNPNVGDGCSSAIGARVMRPCEYNPAFRSVINQVGRRYFVDNVDLLRIGVWAQAMF